MFGSTRRARSTRSAFTLIELLVVIAIIALLIAILLPSLEASRTASKNANCLAHIKSIATSSRVYEADDRQGWGIPVHPLQFRQCPEQAAGGTLCTTPSYIGAYEWGGKSGIGDTYLVEQGPGGECTKDENPLDSKYGTRAGFGPSTRPMNDILYPGGFKDNLHPRFDSVGARRDTEMDLDLFRCPGDDGPPRGAHCQCWIDNEDRSSYDHFGTSYAANVFMVFSRSGCVDSSDCSGVCVRNEMASNSPYLRPISRVPAPSRTLYYEENIGRWAWACRNELGFCAFIGAGVDPGPTKAVRGWHARDWTYNRAFVDAHAETQKVYIEGSEDSEGYALHYRSEVLFAGDDLAASRRRCITVRGDGWQKDTLPAVPIATGLRGPATGRPSYENCVMTQ